MNNKLTTIDPNQGNIPDTAIIQKVVSENDRLPNGEHEKAVKAFYFSDSIASGIGKDFAFVEKIPQLISDIIDNKSWECLYVSRGVVTPYYCRYTKGTDSENFRAFIVAKRPNGLGTTIETIERLLETEFAILNKFQAIVYESQQGKRTDLEEVTSRLEGGKLNELSNRQQERVRAANRAAEAIPEIRELLDRGLISISIAATLGRQIKDPDNLTAEEREYVDKRDLVGLRIKSYINTNTIPEDEDKEPAYSRKLNEFVKDLLGIKNRSKSIRMDNPKKAAQKLLEFYQGERLKELVEYLNKGLKQKADVTNKDNQEILTIEKTISNGRVEKQSARTSNQRSSFGKHGSKETNIPVSSSILEEDTKLVESSDNTQEQSETISEKNPEEKAIKPNENISDSSFTMVASSNGIFDQRLTKDELAERLGVHPTTFSDVFYKRKEKFTQWTQKKDPDNIGWTRTQEKQGRNFLFAPIQKTEEVTT